MRQGNNNNNNSNNNNNNNRRQRGRNNRRNNNQPNRNQVYDSNGPSIRVRGNAQQVMDKYIALAADAQAAGNHVLAEAYFQHGEHYLRIHLTNQAAIEEAKARKAAHREERQERQARAAPPAPSETIAEGDNTKDTAPQQAEAEVILPVMSQEPETPERLDPSEQDQPRVEVLTDLSDTAPESISLIPETNDGDPQPELPRL